MSAATARFALRAKACGAARLCLLAFAPAPLRRRTVTFVEGPVVGVPVVCMLHVEP